MKKSLSILLALACAVSFSFTSCTKKADGKLKIGIIQLVEHVALDQSYQGFGSAKSLHIMHTGSTINFAKKP